MALRSHVMLTPFDASSGAALTSATVNVFQPGTVTPVVGTLFDKNGNTLANPLTSDATTGLVDFYMNVAQEVDLQVAKSGFTTRTYSNVPVLDDAGNDLTALMTTTGDIVYASAANAPARLAAGAATNVLTVAAGIPSWAATVAPPVVALQTASASGSGNIALGAAGTWTDVLSVSLAAGTWFVIANGEAVDTAGAAALNARIYDGATVYAAGRASTTAASTTTVITVSAIITLGGTTTVKLQMKDETSSSGFSQYTVDGISGIRAIRLV